MWGKIQRILLTQSVRWDRIGDQARPLHYGTLERCCTRGPDYRGGPPGVILRTVRTR